LVICGETGSGKTTQLPKMCLELGRGVGGLIAHTQPRRIAARSVAKRIADELGSPLGIHVGYQVRFNQQLEKSSFIKLMTDGILLAELQNDRYLNQYDTIIVDEAHERSLNIDFILGHLKKILPSRPDLKLIITSATINTRRFSEHFSDAPVIEVQGRSYPVEIRYRAPQKQEDEDSDESLFHQNLLKVLDEIRREKTGDVLVFLPGEREIRECAHLIRKTLRKTEEVLPLYSRLTPAQQELIFKPHSGRRFILSTNVAETSLTVPGIRYVVDSGLVRMSRYSYRSKIQRLPIEPVSKASAQQRAGRCGRVGPGICFRLYDEDDFNNRNEFTDPEILRTNLASVILTMQANRLGDIETFPFIDPPDSRFINDGYRLLNELAAINADRRLTPLGRELAKLPVDPKLARIVLAAAELGCLQEGLIIASGLAVQDPRLRPYEKQQAADDLHRRFQDEKSDFISLINLWNYIHEQKEDLSQSKLRKLCQKEFLSYQHLREWQDVYVQLRESYSNKRKISSNPVPDYETLHKAILTGFLGHLGTLSENGEYFGARGSKFYIFPGSGLAKKSPKWLVSAEIVQTNRVYARTVASISPEWVLASASHIVTRQFFEPFWDEKAKQAMIYESVSLYGLTLIPRRKVNLASVDAKEARKVFILHALVRGEYETGASYAHNNHRLIEKVQQQENKVRRLDILVDEGVLFQLFDERIPREIKTAAHFEKWRKQDTKASDSLLTLVEKDLYREGANDAPSELFPDVLQIGNSFCELKYEFDPQIENDGITLVVPIALLNQVAENTLTWLVPGLWKEKIQCLLKSLPKAVRKQFVPVPQYAQAIADSLKPDTQFSFEQAVIKEMTRVSGTVFENNPFLVVELPKHLQMRIALLDENGKELSASRELGELKTRFKKMSQSIIKSSVGKQQEQQIIEQWDFGDLPDSETIQTNGVRLKVVPALEQHEGSFVLSHYADEYTANKVHAKAVLSLILKYLYQEQKYVNKTLLATDSLALLYAPLGSREELANELTALAVRVNLKMKPQDIRKQADFFVELEYVKRNLISTCTEIGKLLREILQKHKELQKRLSKNVGLAQIESMDDIKQQIVHLVYPGFVLKTPIESLKDFPRYLDAVQIRIDKMQGDLQKDQQWMREIRPFWIKWLERKGQSTQWDDFQWMIEEFRVSLYAQHLKTKYPVSTKRLERELHDLNKSR
ncbi:MAG: ATP-dependent RNA helicase HrpA, partial [Gammaproteobacteria bacterium]|nr:ATP-dependent RNA helicase HrpA [Gammaproteobacteria bacterium]